MRAKRVSLRFYAELNDYLPPNRRALTFSLDVAATSRLKDVIEDLGVPLAEVDLILVGGEPTAGDRSVEDGDRISVFPVFESLDISPLPHLHTKPLRRTRFAVDEDLAPLARHLRLLGFDAVGVPHHRRNELVRRAEAEERVLLTRDAGLVERSEVTRGYLVRASKPWDQTREVIDRFDLAGAIRPGPRRLLPSL